MGERTSIIWVILALAGCDPSVTVGGGAAASGGGGAGAGGGSSTSSTTSTSSSTTNTDGFVWTDCDGCAVLAGMVPQPNPCPGAQELLDELTACVCAHCEQECSGVCLHTPGGGDCAPCVQANCKDLENACAEDKRVDVTK